MSGNSPRLIFGQWYRLGVLTLLGLVLAAAGGASRYDEDQQPLVRIAAILAIAASLWPLELEVLRQRAGLIAAVAVVYLLLLLQLAPLPPEVWARLPGHEVYAQIAREAGAVGWRPLSLTPDLTLDALFALLPATAAGLCALFLDSRGRMRLAEGFVAISCVSGLIGLIQLAAGGDALRLYRVTSSDSAVGLLANRNHQAALLACALPMTGMVAGIRLRAGADRRLVLAVALSVATLLLVALVATGSRMGLPLGAVGALGGLWCYRATGQPLVPKRLATRLALAAGAVAVMAALGIALVRGGVLERFASAGVAVETRTAMFGPLLATAKAFMPFGAGFGAFDSVYLRFEPDALLSTIYMNQAHNEPMQLAIEGGLPALVLLALFGWWWGRSAARTVRSDPSARTRTMGIAAMIVTVVLMASSLVDYPLRTPLLGAVFAVACVELMVAAERTFVARRVAPSPSGPAPGVTSADLTEAPR